jgi:hypothetical protein
MVSLLFQPVALAAVGPVSEAIGVRETLLVAAGIGIVANLAVLAVPSVRRVQRREGAVAAPEPATAASAADPTQPPGLEPSPRDD